MATNNANWRRSTENYLQQYLDMGILSPERDVYGLGDLAKDIVREGLKAPVQLGEAAIRPVTGIDAHEKPVMTIPLLGEANRLRADRPREAIARTVETALLPSLFLKGSITSRLGKGAGATAEKTAATVAANAAEKAAETVAKKTGSKLIPKAVSSAEKKAAGLEALLPESRAAQVSKVNAGLGELPKPKATTRSLESILPKRNGLSGLSATESASTEGLLDTAIQSNLKFSKEIKNAGVTTSKGKPIRMWELADGTIVDESGMKSLMKQHQVYEVDGLKVKKPKGTIIDRIEATTETEDVPKGQPPLPQSQEVMGALVEELEKLEVKRLDVGLTKQESDRLGKLRGLARSKLQLLPKEESQLWRERLQIIDPTL